MLIFFSQLTKAVEFNIGVSPDIVDAGSIERGSSKIVSFYVVTISDESFYVYLEPYESTSFLTSTKYSKLIFNWSEEESKNWAQFLQNPVKLEVGKEKIFNLPSVKGQREVNFILKVPLDAEPGYHVFKIIPKPATYQITGGQVAVQTVAVAPVYVLFEVPGNVIRSGEIVGISPSEYRDNTLPINVFFKNTGTVTISAYVSKLYLKNKNNEIVAEGSSAREKIKPNEIKPLVVVLNNVSRGDYLVNATVNFYTGVSEKELPLTFYAPRAVIPAKPREIVIWPLVLIVVVVICYLIYRKK
jgi:hypothetical protein